jgi:hypothetical protein
MPGCLGIHGTRSRTAIYIWGIIVPTDGTRAANMGTGDFGTSPISGSSQTSSCLPVSKYLGGRNVKHNGGSRL